MQYISKDIMLDMLDYIRHQAEFIIETTEDVKELNDFLCSQSGIDSIIARITVPLRCIPGR